MTFRSRSIALVMGCGCLLASAAALAQTIRSFAVEQVPQLVPGTELVFRVQGTAGGTLSLQLDGVANPIVLPETRSGAYEGAYTISIRDKIPYDAKAQATLKFGERQTSALLAQTLLAKDAFAAANAAAHPAPVISRLETRNTGALSGGNEISFLVDGSAGARASVSIDGGKTQIPLVEDKAGHYSGTYTVKTRDRLAEASPVTVTLASGDKTSTATKPLAPGVLHPTVLAAATPPTPAPAPVANGGAVCDVCGVVQSVKKVKVKGKPNYLGAIAGGVAGAALGTQVGKGDGKTAATVVGALGGAVAGREIEKQVRAKDYYDVVVKMGDSSTRTVRFETDPGFKRGSRVRVSGETLVPNE